VELIVIGADNQPDAPWDLALVTNTVYAVSPIKPACHGPKIYIKQLWQLFCDRCGKVFGDADRIDDQVCPCGESYRRRLVTEPAEFPEPLRLRQLPWTLTTK